MDHYKRAEEVLMSRERCLKGVESKVSRIVRAEEFEVDEQRDEHNEEVLNLMLLLPVSEVIVVSYPQPVAYIHEEVAYEQGNAANKGACKDAPRVDVRRHHQLDHNVEQFNEGQKLDHACDDALSFAPADLSDKGNPNQDESSDQKGERNKHSCFGSRHALCIILIQGLSIWTGQIHYLANPIGVLLIPKITVVQNAFEGSF